MSIYDKASLVLIPSGTKTSKVYSQKPTNGDGDFTFSRSTAATRVNASGNIEKETQNLLDYSNTFNQWSVSNITFLGGQTGYDGSNDATQITSSANGGQIRNNGVFTGVNTFSVYAKQGSQVGIRLRMNADTDADIYVDLRDGSLFSSNNIIDSNIEDLGSGWYRCSFSANVSNGANVRIYPVNSSGSISTGSILIQDAQLEQGLVARDYIETTTTAIYGGITDNVPRLDYTDSSCPALLLEPLRTNLVVQSEYFNTWWSTTGNLSFTDNYATSPEGVQNASRWVSTGGAFPQMTRAISGLTIGQTYTTTFYVKSDGTSQIEQSFWVSTLNEVRFTPSSEWTRITHQFTATSTSHTMVLFTNIGAAPASTYLLYGFQFEQGSYATSYIPTYGSAVTRNVDSCSKTGISSLIGQTEGTIYWEVQIDTPIATANEAILNIDGGFFGNTIYLSKSATGNITGEMYVSGGSSQSSFTLVGISAGSYKIAFAYAQNNTAMFVNGVQVGSTDTSCNVPATSRIQLGNTALGPSTDKTKQTLLFKTRLSNEELAALTTI